MDTILTETTVFYPNDENGFPKIEILRMEKLQSGVSGIVDHYLIVISENETSVPIQNTHDTWGEVTRFLDRQYEGKFSKKFPGAEYIRFV